MFVRGKEMQKLVDFLTTEVKNREHGGATE
jgi:hypothetical protein